MANKPGIIWSYGKSPRNLVAQLIDIRAGLDESVERVVSAFLAEAVQEIQESIRTRGVHNHIRNGEGRILTGAMLESVGKVLDYTKGSHHLHAEFGYIFNAPEYTGFQEYGTVNGDGSERVAEMLALTDAFTNFKTKLQNAFEDGSIVNLEGQRYAAATR